MNLDKFLNAVLVFLLSVLCIIILIVIEELTGIGKTEHCYKIKAKYTNQGRDNTHFMIVDNYNKSHEIKGSQYAISNIGDSVCTLEY
jgi:hypothetical protein